MDTLAAFFHYSAIAAVVSVGGVLVLGVVAMAVGGRFNDRWGTRLMSLRVVVQAIAIALLAGPAAITAAQT